MSNLKNFLIPVFSVFIGMAISIVALRASPVLQSKFIETAATDSQRESTQNNISRKPVYDDIFKKHEAIKDDFDSLLNDDFFNDSNPFDSMRKMHDEMEERIGNFDSKNFFKSNPFDNWFSDKFGSGAIEDISSREDDKNIYYDVSVSDLNSTSINTEVENGYITISGEIEKSENDDSGNSYHSKQTYKSSFNRSFPLPENIDESKMETLIEDDKIVIKFPKKINY